MADERHPSDSSACSKQIELLSPYRTLQVLKSTAFGSGGPVGAALSIRPTGGNAPSPSPSYHTLRLPSRRQRLFLPPPFNLYTGSCSPGKGNGDREQLGSVRYKGKVGLIGLDIAANSKVGRRYVGDGQHTTETADLNIDIHRLGWGRQYMVTLTDILGDSTCLMWKGSKTAATLFQDGHPSCNGNLKLVFPLEPEKVLALWKTRSDPLIMGSIVIFASFDEGEMLEAVITSCLAVVAAERMAYRAWFGGIGKHPKDVMVDGNNGNVPEGWASP